MSVILKTLETSITDIVIEYNEVLAEKYEMARKHGDRSHSEAYRLS